jgi:hypothetical protein
LKYYFGICQEGARETHGTSKRGRDLNPGAPNYEAKVVTTTPKRSVTAPIYGWNVTNEFIYMKAYGGMEL